MSVFVSYLGIVNTHTYTHSFFPHLSSYIIRTNKKLADEECVRVHTHTKKKKEEEEEEGRIYTRFENGSNSIGITKKAGKRVRGRDQASK